MLLREPHKVGRLVVPPGSWRFPLKARYDFVNGTLAGDSQRRERLCDPFACPPDAPPAGQDTLLSEAPNYAVENIPRFDEELEAAADDDDLFGKIVEEGPAADLGSGLPSGDAAPVGGDSAKSPASKAPAPPGRAAARTRGARRTKKARLRLRSRHCRRLQMLLPVRAAITASLGTKAKKAKSSLMPPAGDLSRTLISAVIVQYTRGMRSTNLGLALRAG